MESYVNIFCENCGAPIKAEVNQQYVKCNSCSAVVSNPKYLKQEERSNTVKVEGKASIGGLGGFFKNLGKAFSSTIQNSNRGDSFFDDKHYHHHDESFDNRHGFGRNPFETYYAVIKKNAFSYSGECPGISFTSATMCDSYDECLHEIEKKLGDRVGAFNKTFDQPDPSSLNLDRDERIVRVRPKR